MILLTDEQAAVCKERARVYRAVYESNAKDLVHFALPPYEYRPKNIGGKFDATKYMVRQLDCMDYITNRAEANVAQKCDVNIIALISECGAITEKDLIGRLEAEAKIYPDKELLQGRSGRAVSGRLIKLCEANLLRELRCCTWKDNTLEILPKDSGAPIAYIATPDGYKFAQAKKRGIIRSYKDETWAPALFCEKLIANEMIDILLKKIPDYSGMCPGQMPFRNNDYKVLFGRNYTLSDGCVSFGSGEDEIKVLVLSITYTADIAVESRQDMEDHCMMKVASAREFIYQQHFRARVVFVCENMEAVDMLVDMFGKLRFSEVGVSEFCYITTAALNLFCKVNERDPLSALLQVAFSENDKTNYLIGAATKLMAPKERLCLTDTHDKPVGLHGDM